MKRTTTDTLTLTEDEVREAIQKYVEETYCIKVKTKNISLCEDRIYVQLDSTDEVVPLV